MSLHYRFGDGGQVAGLLRAGPVECYFVGASVTAQKAGWAEKLLGLLRRETGHAHTLLHNTMGGVGLLFGLAHHRLYPRQAQTRIAFIEFSTGDLNQGLTPADKLEPWLDELVGVLHAEQTPVVFVLHWRGDFPSDDPGGVRRTYALVAQRHGVPLIENHLMVDEALISKRVDQALWFRDLIHTQEPGAQAYADHTWACLQHMASPELTQAAERGSLHATQAPTLFGTQADRIGTLEYPPSLWPDAAEHSTYEYPGTGQRFQVLVLNSQTPLRARMSGQLLGVAMISGPRSCWVSVWIDGKRLRNIRVFDRNSHYSRYVLLPTVATLTGQLVELRCDSDPIDFASAGREHPDFSLPRQLQFVHWVGRGLAFS